MQNHRPLSRRRAIFAAASFLPLNRFARAQDASQSAQSGQAQPTFSSSVKVVDVFATVHDQHGKIINDLTKDDFQLEEDSRPQTIRYFSRQTDLPLTVGLLVDTSMSERRMIDQEKEATRTFLEDVLRPNKDKGFLIHFDRDVELLQDLTASREKLQKALDQLNRPQWGHVNSGDSGDQSGGQNDPDSGSRGGYGGGGYGGGRGRRQGGYGGGGTHLYDAIYLASDEVLKNQTGRKALMLLTDGEDNGSKISVAEAITTAQRADTLAYSIHIADEETSNPFGGFGGPGMGRHGGMGGPGGGMGRGPYGGARPNGKKILQQISRETGGGYFEYSKKKSIGDIYGQIEEELRNQYSIGYTSDRPDSDPGFRKIKLTVKKKNLVVQAREGYYAGGRT